jgi:hypothetical protein
VQFYPEAVRADGGWLARDAKGVLLWVPDWNVNPSPVVEEEPKKAKEVKRGSKPEPDAAAE